MEAGAPYTTISLAFVVLVMLLIGSFLFTPQSFGFAFGRRLRRTARINVAAFALWYRGLARIGLAVLCIFGLVLTTAIGVLAIPDIGAYALSEAWVRLRARFRRPIAQHQQS